MIKIFGGAHAYARLLKEDSREGWITVGAIARDINLTDIPTVVTIPCDWVTRELTSDDVVVGRMTGEISSLLFGEFQYQQILAHPLK